MTEPAGLVRPPAGAPSRAAEGFRWTLLAVVVLVAVAFPVVAVHQVSLGDLREAVASGAVRELGISGGLPPGAVGSATVRVRWERGGIASETSLVQASDPNVADSSSETGEDPVIGDLRQYLRDLPGGQSVQVTPDDSPRPGGSMLGWDVPPWMSAMAVLLWVLTLGLLIAGPEPRRATRWAWFWLLVNPVGILGVPAFLALGGRLPRQRTRPAGRRLTGGWAFLISSLLTGISSQPG